MTQDTFDIQVDGKGQRFVFQSIGESAKPEDTIGEARMYEIPNSSLCPLQSFLKYKSKLNPDIPELWQRPLDSFNPAANIWYYKAPLGKNTLSKMMPKISSAASLSKIYTNHSIRATCIMLLDDAGIEAWHIMRISGHRNESSIRSYTCRLNDNKKREISQTLSAAVASTSTMALVPFTTKFSSSCSDATETTITAIKPSELVTPISESNFGCVSAPNNESDFAPALTPNNDSNFAPPTPSEATFELIDLAEFMKNIPEGPVAKAKRPMNFVPQFINCSHINLNINLNKGGN